MLIILDAQKHTNHTFSQKIKSFFRPCEIRVTLKSQSGISLAYIQYHYYRGNINFKKIAPLIGGCSKNILCNENFPIQNTNFKRFDSYDFDIKMMQNFILSVLENSDIPPDKLSIGYFDPKAEYYDFVRQILKYSSRLVVFTDMPKFYENLSENSFIVSNSTKTLYDCDILICPAVIERPVSIKNNSIVFTVKNPLFSVNGTVISLYHIDFPRFFSELKPENLSESYFLSALYSIYRIKQLGEIIPVKCSNAKNNYSQKEIIQLLYSFLS